MFVIRVQVDARSSARAQPGAAARCAAPGAAELVGRASIVARTAVVGVGRELGAAGAAGALASAALDGPTVRTGVVARERSQVKPAAAATAGAGVERHERCEE